MKKAGGVQQKAMDLISTQLYVEIRVEKMIEFHIRFFIARILIWLLKRVLSPCKVEIKKYEQSGNRSKASIPKRGTNRGRRN
jgi:hypothetical protein